MKDFISRLSVLLVIMMLLFQACIRSEAGRRAHAGKDKMNSAKTDTLAAAGSR